MSSEQCRVMEGRQEYCSCHNPSSVAVLEGEGQGDMERSFINMKFMFHITE